MLKNILEKLSAAFPLSPNTNNGNNKANKQEQPEGPSSVQMDYEAEMSTKCKKLGMKPGLLVQVIKQHYLSYQDNLELALKQHPEHSPFYIRGHLGQDSISIFEGLNGAYLGHPTGKLITPDHGSDTLVFLGYADYRVDTGFGEMKDTSCPRWLSEDKILAGWIPESSFTVLANLEAHSEESKTKVNL